MELMNTLTLAFLGGVILNVMPCVLPVLTLKVFHVIEHQDLDARANKIHGLAYALGILLTFAAFAAVIVGLKMAGERVFWGVTVFKHPPVIASLCILMLVFGLNALGVFEFSVSVNSENSDGYKGSFVNGIIATLMALPCSAPILASATGYAVAADTAAWITVLIFLFIGLGLAFPFLLISFVPATGKILPRPGAWMETFKHVMGFTLLAAAVWLYGVLVSTVTSSSATWFLALLLMIGISLWAINRFGGLQYSRVRRLGVRGLSVLAAVAFAFFFVTLDKPVTASEQEGFVLDAEPVKDGHIQWIDYTPNYVAITQKQRRPIFVDFTADW
jgi:thiol:disulfide interchange protein DsbD